MKLWLLKKLLPGMAQKFSPFLRDALVKFVSDIEAKAKATPNKWDDVLVYVLKLLTAV